MAERGGRAYFADVRRCAAMLPGLPEHRNVCLDLVRAGTLIALTAITTMGCADPRTRTDPGDIAAQLQNVTATRDYIRANDLSSVPSGSALGTTVIVASNLQFAQIESTLGGRYLIETAAACPALVEAYDEELFGFGRGPRKLFQAHRDTILECRIEAIFRLPDNGDQAAQ